jgi:hypothetical protein
MADTMVDKEERRLTRTERELTRLGEGRVTQRKVKPKAKKKVKPKKEKIGIGRDHAAENKARLLQDLDMRIRAAQRAKNQDLVNKYSKQKNALESM